MATPVQGQQALWLTLLCFTGARRAPTSPFSPISLMDFAIQPCPWAESTDSILTLQPPAQPASDISSQTRLINHQRASSTYNWELRPAHLQPSSQQLTKQGIEQTRQEQRKCSHGIRSGVKISQWPATSIMNGTEECQSHTEEKLTCKKSVQPLTLSLSLQQGKSKKRFLPWGRN